MAKKSATSTLNELLCISELVQVPLILRTCLFYRGLNALLRTLAGPAQEPPFLIRGLSAEDVLMQIEQIQHIEAKKSANRVPIATLNATRWHSSVYKCYAFVHAYWGEIVNFFVKEGAGASVDELCRLASEHGAEIVEGLGHTLIC